MSDPVRDADADALLRAATYLKWWRDGAITETEAPDDVDEIIILLEDLAYRLRREPSHFGDLDDEMNPRP